MIDPAILDRPAEPYATVSPLISSGDLLLCSGTAPFSRLIQGATDSPWSHVAFLMRMPAVDQIIVLESVESSGTRAVALSSYVRDYNGSGRGYPGRLLVVRHRGFAAVESGQLAKISRFAIERLGRRYDRQEILAIAQRVVAAKLGLPTHEAHRDGVYICSEWVEQLSQAAGIVVPYDKRGFIAPDDFAAAPEVEAVALIQTEVLV